MNFARTCALLAAAPLAALCLATGTASAADVASVTVGDGTARYEGTPGDDELRTGYSDGEVYFGQVTGKPITAGPGCELDDKYKWVTCKLPASAQVIVDFGAGGDRLEGAARSGITTPIRVDGGPGADELHGNDGNDVLIGGPDADTIAGGGGDDVLDYQDGGPDARQGECGEGNDVLKVDPKGVDLERYADGCEAVEAARTLGGTASAGFDDTRVQFTPEPGIDHDLTISREGDGLRMTDPSGIVASTGGVRDRPSDPTTVFCPHAKGSYGNEVDLGDGNDRVRLVGDPLHGEAIAVNGGDGNDTIEDGPGAGVLDGGAGDDVLLGAGGNDSLRGGEGDDRLTGGADPDKLLGGAGNDAIDSRDGGVSSRGTFGENVDCGAGRDALTVDVSDFPQRTCERVVSRDTTPTAAGTLQIVGGSTLRMSNERTPSLRVKVRCVGGPCTGGAYLFGGRSYIFPFNASKPVRLQAGQTGTALMRFGSGFGSFREYLGKKRRLRMYVATLVGDEEGRTKTVKRAVTVTARAGLK